MEDPVADKLLLQAKAVAALELANPEKNIFYTISHMFKVSKKKLYSNLHGGKKGFGPPIPFITDMIFRKKRYKYRTFQRLYNINCFLTCFLIHSIRDSAFSP